MSAASIFRSSCQPLEPQPTSIKAQLNASFPPIRAVVFDIYGTLFISGSGDIGVSAASKKNDVLATLLRDLFDLTSVEPQDLSDRLLTLIANSHAQSKEQGVAYPEVEIREIWQEFLLPLWGGPIDEAQVAELAVRYEVAVNPVWPMPKLEETLHAIRQKGLTLGIVSNAQFYTPSLFEAFLGQGVEALGFHPSLCLYSYQERQAKPGEYLYRKLQAQLAKEGMSPSEVLYVGNDMLNDIAPARAVGFQTVLFAGDARSLRLREEHQLGAPAAVITELSQILTLLGESSI